MHSQQDPKTNSRPNLIRNKPKLNPKRIPIVKKIQEIITHFFDNLAHTLSKELFIKPDRTKLNINEKPI